LNSQRQERILKRRDYEVEIQGSNPAARYLLDHVTVSGIVLPSKMRIFQRQADNTTAAEPLIVSVDLSDYYFESAVFSRPQTMRLKPFCTQKIGEEL
jgi:hypothetical protein